MATASPFDPPHPLGRLAPLGALALLSLSLVVWAAGDAAARRRQRRDVESTRLAAARVAGPELALHAASRWLRHPTRSEPWAASADAPAMLDVDPAGAIAPPPVAVLRAGLSPVRLAVRRGGR
jgi:hypothetical protein